MKAINNDKSPPKYYIPERTPCFLHFRNRKGGKYRGAFLLAENDDLASKHEVAHGVKRKRSD